MRHSPAECPWDDLNDCALNLREFLSRFEYNDLVDGEYFVQPIPLISSAFDGVLGKNWNDTAACMNITKENRRRTILKSMKS